MFGIARLRRLAGVPRLVALSMTANGLFLALTAGLYFSIHDPALPGMPEAYTLLVYMPIFWLAAVVVAGLLFGVKGCGGWVGALISALGGTAIVIAMIGLAGVRSA